MRVLYLAPAGRRPEHLSRYSFLDEEIRALADAGVEAYVVSTASPIDVDQGRLHIRALPQNSLVEGGKTLGFLSRRVAGVPWANLTEPVRCHTAVRIERFAAEVIKRERISLIHSYFGWPRGYGGILARAATGIPLVAGLRGSDVNVDATIGYGSRLTASYDRAIRRLLRVADATVYVSEFLKRKGEALGSPPGAGRVILKGVRLDLFCARADRALLRAQLGWGPRPVILAVSGLVRIKGLNHVLEALGAVRKSGLDFSFIVCGEGPERETLDGIAQRCGLADRVQFAGRVPRAEITKYFAACDLLVHGALIEASGNVLLEAMAASLPIVCTDAGGPAEYVRDGVTGFVVPVGDPAAMAQKVALLLSDQNLRQAQGSSGRKHALANFGYERMIDDTLAVYSSVLGDVDSERFHREKLLHA